MRVQRPSFPRSANVGTSRRGRGLSGLLAVVSIGVILLTPTVAQALTLDDVAQAYEEKLGQVGAYRVSYRLCREESDSGKTTSSYTYVHQLIASPAGFRLETSVEDSRTKRFVPFTTITNNDREFRSHSFTNDGRPNVGTIRKPLVAFSAYDSILHSPIGRVGLHDSVPYFPAGNSSVYTTDIRALARDPRSKLLDNPTMLDGESAFIIEYPANTQYPVMRFWLAKEKNLALLRCECYLFDSSGNYRLATQTVNTAFWEVKPGLFLPRKSEFRVAEIEGLGPGGVMSIEAISYDLAIEVSDEDLCVDFPDGIYVNDERGVLYAIGGGIRGLSQILRSADVSFTGLTGAILLVVLVVILVVAWIVVRAAKRGRTTDAH